MDCFINQFSRLELALHSHRPLVLMLTLTSHWRVKPAAAVTRPCLWDGHEMAAPSLMMWLPAQKMVTIMPKWARVSWDSERRKRTMATCTCAEWPQWPTSLTRLHSMSCVSNNYISVIICKCDQIVSQFFLSFVSFM